MINPLAPYEVAGVLWYQGENNAGRGYEYRAVFPLLIADWRAKWHKDLPFYFCQLPNFRAKKTVPAESDWAELRESQSAALRLPNTEQAVLIDLGEAGDIHPRNKQDVADRLARIAEAKQYGRSIPYSGPVYEAMEADGSGKVRLKFRHVEGGLAAKPLPARYDVKTIVAETAPLLRNSPNSELEGFAICGEDRHWQWAEAKIDGETVLVWSGKVPHPIAVRYGWADNPTCNLSNKAGLPAAPFRTDDFSTMTADRHYGSGA
jgi:sialate O-acetylesterase